MSVQERILSHCNLDGISPRWVIIGEFRGLRASARLALCLLVFASTDRAQYLQFLFAAHVQEIPSLDIRLHVYKHERSTRIRHSVFVSRPRIHLEIHLRERVSK